MPSNGTPQTVRECLRLFESLQSGQSVGHLVAVMVFCGSYRAKCSRVARGKTYRTMVGVSERKTPPGKLQLKCYDVIKVNLQDIRFEVMSQNRDQVGLL